MITTLNFGSLSNLTLLMVKGLVIPVRPQIFSVVPVFYARVVVRVVERDLHVRHGRPGQVAFDEALNLTGQLGQQH